MKSFMSPNILREAADRVQPAEDRQLRSEVSDLLSGTKHVWRKNPDNGHEADKLNFDALAFLWMESRQSLATQGTFQTNLGLF